MLRFNDKNIENEDLLRCVEEARVVLKKTKEPKTMSAGEEIPG